MIHIIIGAVAATGMMLLIDFVGRRNLNISWWQWLFTILGFCYAVFVLEIIVGFLSEGTVRAALVMGMVFGIWAVVWGVLLARLVFLRNANQ